MPPNAPSSSRLSAVALLRPCLQSAVSHLLASTVTYMSSLSSPSLLTNVNHLVERMDRTFHEQLHFVHRRIKQILTSAVARAMHHKRVQLPNIYGLALQTSDETFPTRKELIKPGEYLFFESVDLRRVSCRQSCWYASRVIPSCHSEEGTGHWVGVCCGR
jgi:hypothetical protein